MGHAGRDQLFISYAHEDSDWKDEFERMLAPARNRGLIATWSDTAIAAGEDWLREIEHSLARARMGLLLVSDHFLESDFINNVELRALLESARGEGVSIRWVPITASLYQYTDLKDIQACCDPKRPLNTLGEAERRDVIQEICRELVEEFATTGSVSEDFRESLKRQVEKQLGGKYKIGAEVASGKFSIFYEADRTEPARKVGVKTFVASELEEWATRAFRKGVSRAVTLTSPAFIKILDDYLDEPPHSLVTEFVTARPLSTLLRERREGLRPSYAQTILVDLATAIDEAHQQGWRRGEICPSDVLIQESGEARLSALDFSNIVREYSQLAGNFLVDRESLAFMTPERYYGWEVSEKTDQYSLALLATELLGGIHVPRVMNPCDLSGKPELFAELEAGKGAWAQRSPEFAGVLSRMLRIDPEARWPSMSVVVDLIKQLDLESATSLRRKLVKTSYLRTQAKGIESERAFYETFYKKLFAIAPELESHFKKVDMERQYLALNQAVHLLLEYDENPEVSRERLGAIADTHRRFSLERDQLQAFVDALIETLAAAGESGEQTFDAWRRTVQPGIDYLWQCLQEEDVRREEKEEGRRSKRRPPPPNPAAL